MDDFFGFRRMITPVLVRVMFWIGLVVVVILGIKLLGENALIGLGVLVVGPLIVRIYCEFLILFFRINETLTDILQVLERTVPAGARSTPVTAAARPLGPASAASEGAARRSWDWPAGTLTGNAGTPPTASAPPQPDPIAASGRTTRLENQYAKISLSPASGPPGTEVLATLSGFAAEEEIDVRWVTAGGGWSVLERVRASLTGSVSVRFVVPPTAEVGFQEVEITVRGDRRAARMFEVTKPVTEPVTT